ncbi:MAG: SDR family NAD(P)-dependent oxidoreductase, partial [Saccharofermentanales bacterium]
MKNKVCVVTGGANGIGRCITERFIQDGYFVAVIDLDVVSGRKLLDFYDKGSLMFYRGDITEPKIIESFVKEIAKETEQVDVLVNNACINKGGLDSCSYDDFNYVLKLGVSAPFYLTKLLMPHFRKGASIINISSTRAFMSQSDTESYTAAKGG